MNIWVFFFSAEPVYCWPNVDVFITGRTDGLHHCLIVGCLGRLPVYNLHNATKSHISVRVSIAVIKSNL